MAGNRRTEEMGVTQMGARTIRGRGPVRLVGIRKSSEQRVVFLRAMSHK